MKRRAALFTLAAATLGGRRALAIRPAPPPRLIATLTATPVGARDGDIEVTLRIVNPSDALVPLSLVAFYSPITCLEVNDGTRRVPTIPPGVPRPVTEADTMRFAPQQSRTFTFRLNIYSPPLPAGRYTVTLRANRWVRSPDPVRFEIRP